MGRPLAYLANADADVPIYDLSDPTAPVLLERVETPPREHGSCRRPRPLRRGRPPLPQRRDRRLLRHGPRRRRLDRGRQPARPAAYNHANWVGEIAGRKVSVMGDEGYGAHLQVVDVDPASKEFMTVIGEYQTRPEAGIHNIMLFGTRAYVDLLPRRHAHHRPCRSDKPAARRLLPHVGRGDRLSPGRSKAPSVSTWIRRPASSTWPT